VVFTVTSLRTPTHQINFKNRFVGFIQQFNMSTGTFTIYIEFTCCWKNSSSAENANNTESRNPKTSHGNVPLCPCAYAVTSGVVGNPRGDYVLGIFQTPPRRRLWAPCADGKLAKLKAPNPAE